MGFINPIVGGTSLRIPAIQSPDFQAGVSGWIVRIDGSAEFNNLTIRGQFFGTDFIINSSGIFLYSGTPAAGNLIMSIAPSAGIDAFGNAYQSGYVSYGDPLGNSIITQLAAGILNLASTVSAAQATFDFTGMDLNDGTFITKYLNTELRFLLAADDPVTNDPGGLFWDLGDAVQRYLRLTSGDDTTHQAAFLWLFGEDASANEPYIRIDNGGPAQISLVNHTVDMGRGIQSQAEITANVTGITTTEVALITIPSMTYKNGRSYRVTLWGLQQSTTAATYFLHRLRKGSASTTGTIYKDQMRVPVINAASTNGAVSLTFTLVNTTGADITTAVTWTGSVAAGTGIFAASAGNHATATVEDAGLASQWPGQPIS